MNCAICGYYISEDYDEWEMDESHLPCHSDCLDEEYDAYSEDGYY